MTIVVDASVTAAWHFRDQDIDASHRIIFRAIDDGALVPSYWQFETANALLVGLRQGRTTADAVAQFSSQLRNLPRDEHQFGQHEAFDTVLPLAERFALKMFDAGYLALAVSKGLPLATFDRKLAAAALSEGVEVLGLVV